jgi:uncharacterized protein YlxP (DUF503 family)
MPAFVALLSVQIHLPDAQSLKDKRMTLRRIKDRLKPLNVAVAEVEHQELWQRAGLGVVAIGNTRAHVDEMLASALADIERHVDGFVTGVSTEFLT